jgi:quinol monooxygenase YgiN
MRKVRILIYTLAMSFLLTASATAQHPKQIVRLAKMVVDSAHLENYKALLKEGIETSVKTEPGVLTLNAVYEKHNPTHVTVLEIYASEEAYRSHLQTPHFLKYKNGTKDMVKSLELIDMVPIAMESKSRK